MVHYQFVNEVQSARISRIRLVVVQLKEVAPVEHNRSINNFKPTLKTFYWYNLRTCAVEHTCKFTVIHVKNTYQMCKYISVFFMIISLLS